METRSKKISIYATRRKLFAPNDPTRLISWVADLHYVLERVRAWVIEREGKWL